MLLVGQLSHLDARTILQAEPMFNDIFARINDVTIGRGMRAGGKGDRFAFDLIASFRVASRRQKWEANFPFRKCPIDRRLVLGLSPAQFRLIFPLHIYMDRIVLDHVRSECIHILRVTSSHQFH